MKKLLSLISAFNITILSSLTSVACNENTDQKTTGDSTEQEGNELSTIEEETFFEQDNIDSWTSDEVEKETEAEPASESDSQEKNASVPTDEQNVVEDNKEDLSAIVNLHLPRLEADSTQIYSVLNNKIIASNVFEFKRFRKGFKVKYFDAQTDGAEITATKQKASTVWVEISANRINPFWKGKTNRISITLNAPTLKVQTNLNTIADQIPAVKFRLNQPYSSLNLQIVNSIKEFKTKPLTKGYQIDYYAEGAVYGKNKIDSNTAQKIGLVYVKITAAANDPNWTGLTNKLKIELKKSIKKDLNTIRDILFAPISNSIFKVNTAQSYNNLDLGIIQKLNQLDVFKVKPLAKGCQIKYYTWSLISGYTEIASSTKQTVGKVYVGITPALTDRNWTGSTKFKIRLTA